MSNGATVYIIGPVQADLDRYVVQTSPRAILVTRHQLELLKYTTTQLCNPARMVECMV